MSYDSIRSVTLEEGMQLIRHGGAKTESNIKMQATAIFICEFYLGFLSAAITLAGPMAELAAVGHSVCRFVSIRMPIDPYA